MQYATTKRTKSLNLPKPVGIILALIIIGAVSYEIVIHHSWGALFIIIVLLASVCLHELGHYVVARRCKVKVTEYFVGFGPKLWSFTKNNIEYGVRVLPLGGYVKIVGMNMAEKVPEEDEPHTYRQASFTRRVAIALAGPAVNLFLCVALVWGVYTFIGLPVQQTGSQVVGFDSVNSVASPAKAAGLQRGDIIIAVDHYHLQSTTELRSILQHNKNSVLHIKAKKPTGKTISLNILPKTAMTRHERVWRLGILVQNPTINVTQNPLVAVKNSLTRTWEAAGQELGALGNVFSPSGFHTYEQEITNPRAKPAPTTIRLSSPVGILHAASQAQTQGWAILLLLAGIINLSLGLINLAPIPPLDGGHIAVAAYEKIRSRKHQRYFANPQYIAIVTIAVLTVIGIIAMASLYLDFTKPIPSPWG